MLSVGKYKNEKVSNADVEPAHDLQLNWRLVRPQSLIYE